MGRSNSALIQSTQAQLSMVAQEASNLIATTIAEPSFAQNCKSLMAVIAPKTMGIGGWSGPKTKDRMDGGGAPCPKDFLQRKEDRQNRNKMENKMNDGKEFMDVG